MFLTQNSLQLSWFVLLSKNYLDKIKFSLTSIILFVQIKFLKSKNNFGQIEFVLHQTITRIRAKNSLSFRTRIQNLISDIKNHFDHSQTFWHHLNQIGFQTSTNFMNHIKFLTSLESNQNMISNPDIKKYLT